MVDVLENTAMLPRPVLPVFIFLVIVQLDAQIFFQCIYLFIVLYMFRTCHAYHQEKQIVSIQLMVIVTPCWW